MRDYIHIGPAPASEDCAQVGETGFRERAKKEMQLYIDQTYRQFSELENSSVYLKAKWFQHDFGSYGEVVVCYDDENPEQIELALKIEREVLDYWDEESIKIYNEEIAG